MPKKILLADDSLTIQKVVELTFSDSDFDLVCVGNGLRALEKLKEDRPDLILADVVMPEKNGYEVCEAIKGDPTTSRIPVILLTGTFEPFDRQRAERIGADAIVSKPFDSQQLLRQVEALLSRSGVVTSAATVALRIPEEISLGAGSPAGRGPEAEPFDAGFTAEDFTGSIRVPTGDPFEEEYGRGDVDSAIAAFEKAETVAPTTASPPARETPNPIEEEIDESSWLAEEPERQGAGERGHWVTAEMMPAAPPLFRGEPSSKGTLRADEAPTAEIVTGRRDLRPTEPFPGPPAAKPVEEISADAAEVLFDIPPLELDSGPESEEAAEPSEPSPRPEAPADRGPAAAPEAPPQELEALAQTSSIPELAQMLSSVSRGADLSDADIDRLAARVVEKLSDRVIREIAWEVIPDMAELVIKQRIKELEAGLE
jgi:CheY-like chemotaxis protein